MTGRGTGRRVAEAVAKGAETPEGLIQFVSLGGELDPVEAGPAIFAEHAADLLERETGGLRQRDQRQPFEHARIEQPFEPVSADRGDQPLLLIKAELRRCAIPPGPDSSPSPTRSGFAGF